MGQRNCPVLRMKIGERTGPPRGRRPRDYWGCKVGERPLLSQWLSGLLLAFRVAVEEQIVQELGKVRLVVDLLEELEVHVDHVLHVVANLVIERQTGVLAGVDREAGRQPGIRIELLFQGLQKLSVFFLEVRAESLIQKLQDQRKRFELFLRLASRYTPLVVFEHALDRLR